MREVSETNGVTEQVTANNCSLCQNITMKKHQINLASGQFKAEADNSDELHKFKDVVDMVSKISLDKSMEKKHERAIEYKDTAFGS